MATIVLFDIDGTLLHSHGAGKRALDRAFADSFSTADAFDGVEFAGRTDPAIIRSALENADLPATPEHQSRVIARYLEHLHRELECAHVELLAGVEALLAELRAEAGMAVGLGTGNVEAGARAKLVAAGLDEVRFEFGGFGDDAEDRAEMLEVGARRGASRLGVSRDRCSVWIVGDTPRDVAAAHHIGARALGVATGPFTRAELEATGADETSESLLDPRVAKALRS